MKNLLFKRLKRLVCVALAGQMVMMSLAGCGAEPATDTSAEMQQETPADDQSDAPEADVADGDEQVDMEYDTTGGYPWINSDLKQNLTDDMELSLVDDYHLYVNYDWLISSEIPDGKRGINSFSQVADDTLERAVAVLTDDSLESHDAELIQTFYNLILDWDTRDELGVTPIQSKVDDILSIDSIEEYGNFMSDNDRCNGVACLLCYWNDTDMIDSSIYSTGLYYDGFILGDASEYTNRTEQGDRYYEAYLYLAQEMLGRFGYSADEAQDMLDDVIDFEAQIAEASLTSDDWMSPDIYDRIYNVYTPEELWELAPNLPLEQYAEAFGYADANYFVINEPDQIVAIGDLYTEDNLEILKEYSLVKYVCSMASWLDSEAYDAYVESTNIMFGTEGRTSDEEMAFDAVRSYLTTPMDRAYLECYDYSEAKERVTEIIIEIIDSYREVLSEEDWLADETIDAAIEKLDNITINALYPDKWEDYSSLDFTGMSLCEVQDTMGTFFNTQNAEKTNGTVDKEIWGFDILEANAYYSPVDNSINIILGILGEPFYYEGMSDEELYGTLGIIIGHEISHAFDPNGAQFDKDGNYNFWWTEEDYEAFTDKAQKLIDYYDSIYVWTDQTVYGDNIQTEAIADMGGMKAVLNIAAGIDGFDYDEFFTSYAMVWRRLNTYEFEYYALTQDTHPLQYLRTNVTVQQFDEFYETYGVEEGDGMYLAPEDRVAVW